MEKYNEATSGVKKETEAESGGEPVIMPVEAEAPAREHKKIDIDIAVDD